MCFSKVDMKFSLPFKYSNICFKKENQHITVYKFINSLNLPLIGFIKDKIIDIISDLKMAVLTSNSVYCY